MIQKELALESDLPEKVRALKELKLPIIHAPGANTHQRMRRSYGSDNAVHLSPRDTNCEIRLRLAAAGVSVGDDNTVGACYTADETRLWPDGGHRGDCPMLTSIQHDQ
jgi:hypothetical protein